jgi:uracil-DNA glycosylase family 4
VSRRELLAYLRDFGWRDVCLNAGGPCHTSGDGGESRTPGTAPGGAEDGGGAAALDLGGLAESLRECRRCRLSEGRRNVVFGVGDPRARLMFIGEAPGAEEDRQGEPFVGRAGHLLNSMLRAVGLSRQEVYIANVLKCRPPGNRDPQEDEAATCLPFLWRQVELVNPAVIVTLGRVAASRLLGTSAPISTYRGRWTKWREWDVLPTFHPAYLLRTPSAKAQAWADLKRLVGRLGEQA